MFGYIKPYKPYLRICEFSLYKAFYCGLCKELKRYGFIYRLSLSYDFTFLGLLYLAVNEKEFSVKRCHCPVHPLTKINCIAEKGSLEFVASAAVISIYYKICDNAHDSFWKKPLYYVLMALALRGYKKAERLYPELAKHVEKHIKYQNEIEKNNCSDIDMAAENTSRIMAEIAAVLSDSKDKRNILSRLGYFMGRYVYLSDALDDAKKDFRKKNYNPLLLQSGSVENNSINIKKVSETAELSINLSLGEIAECYNMLNIKSEYLKPILDNIIYLGLKNTIYFLGKTKKEQKEIYNQHKFQI